MTSKFTVAAVPTESVLLVVVGLVPGELYNVDMITSTYTVLMRPEGPLAWSSSVQCYPQTWF